MQPARAYVRLFADDLDVDLLGARQTLVPGTSVSRKPKSGGTPAASSDRQNAK